MTTPWFQSNRIDPAAIVANVPQPFASASDVPSWTATPSQTPGVTPGAILVAGTVFMLDPLDTTSWHDGVLVCVSADGKRYKSYEFGTYAVESKTVSAPPILTASVYNKAWIVPAAATGAWAGHDGEIAIASGRGWVFLDAFPGIMVYVIDADNYFHVDAAGAWVSGSGSPTAGSVSLPALEWPFGILVESRTTSTPPVAAGRKAYIVPSSATGAWAGYAGYVAVGPTGGWEFIQPVAGAEVWCKDEGKYLRYTSGVWSSDAGAIPSLRMIADDAALTIAGNTYAWAIATAPTLANTAGMGLALNHSARSAGNRLRIKGRAVFATTTVASVGLFIDGAATADQWLPVSGGTGTGATAYNFEFFVTASDTVQHSYEIRAGANIATPSSRFMTIEEMSVLQ